MWFKCVPFYGWVIFHCVYEPQLLYTFICQWTSRLRPCSINSAVMNNGMHVSFWITAFLGNVPTSGIAGSYGSFRGFLDSSVVKNPPLMQETRVQYLGQEDPLEEGMATHSSILAWRIPWTEEPSGLQSMGLQRARHAWSDTAQHSTW